MAIDVPRLEKLLTDTLIRDLGEEVKLVFCYGSHVSSTTHEYSDIDISYVPTDESEWHSITVVVDGVMIDCYPIHWSRLKRMAAFEDVSCTVLLHSRVIYSAGDEVLNRFRQVPKQLAAVLRLGCLYHSEQILHAVTHCLAVLNQKTIDTRKIDEVVSLNRLPEEFARILDNMVSTTDPAARLSATEQLLDSTRSLLLTERESAGDSLRTHAEVLDACYPEFLGDLMHVKRACRRSDRYAMLLSSLYHELMVDIALAQGTAEYDGLNTVADHEQDLTALGFPDLVDLLTQNDLDGLAGSCDEFDQRLREYLAEHAVRLNRFGSLDELEMFLGHTNHPVENGNRGENGAGQDE
jgi:predicted nucleotidyltransferase